MFCETVMEALLAAKP